MGTDGPRKTYYKDGKDTPDTFVCNKDSVASIAVEILKDGSISCYYFSKNSGGIEGQKESDMKLSTLTMFSNGEIVPIILMSMMKFYHTEGREKEFHEIMNSYTRNIQFDGRNDDEERPIVSPSEAFLFKVEKS